MHNYIKWIRQHVGTDRIFLNVCCALIFNEKGQLLMQLRSDYKDEAWGMPGGAMEIGESAEETVKREVKEETGLNFEIKKFIGVYTKNSLEEYPNGDKCHMIVFIFAGKGKGTLCSNDGESLKLTYFDVTKRPKLYRSYLEIALKDYLDGKSGIIR